MYDALHSVRSLLCTSINCTPHERMFVHARRSVNGTTLPSWLKPGPVFVKKHVRNKDEPLVEEAELIEFNPSNAHVRLSNGRETTVSIRDVAPRVQNDASESEIEIEKSGDNKSDSTDVPLCRDSSVVESSVDSNADVNNHYLSESVDSEAPPENIPRRSTHARKPVIRYGAVPYE